jgi:hypothetical protein
VKASGPRRCYNTSPALTKRTERNCPMATKRLTTMKNAVKLEKFNETAHCVKCGSMSVAARFKKTRERARGIVERTCERCHYAWKELPLDS